MATGYGGWIGGDDWRAIVVATVANKNDTTCTVTVTGRLESVYAYSSQWQGTLTSSGSGGTNTTKFACQTYQTVDFKTNAFDVTRGKSATTVTVRCAVYNSNYGETSTATVSVTIPAKTSYAVTYDANGGSGAPTSQTKWHGETLALSSTKPTRTGYTFAGWNTNSGGTGTSYASGASYTANAALKLYAKWDAITYTVKYSANGGSSTPANQTKTHGVALTLRAAIARVSATSTFTVTYNANGGTCSTASHNATKTTSYAFSKWKSSSDGALYDASGPYTVNAATTMTAQWTSSTSTGQVTLPTPTRTNYSFNGWYTAPTGGTKVGNAGAKYTPTANVTLYAQWTLTYTAPKITKMTVKRCAAQGNLNDEGTYCKCYVAWTAGTAKTTQVKLTVNGATTPYTVSVAAGASGSTTQTIGGGNLLTTARYPVTAELYEGTAMAATKVATLTAAYFMVHLRQDGKGVGLGMRAIAGINGMFVAMVARFYENVHGVANDLVKDTRVTVSTLGKGMYFDDANGDFIGRISSAFKDDGREGVQIDAFRTVGGTDKTATLFMGVDESGNASVGVNGAGAAAAWRSAIGVGTIGTKDSLAASDIPNHSASKVTSGTLNSARLPTVPVDKGGTGQTGVTTVTNVASFIAAASGVTVSSVRVTVWGKLVHAYVTAKPDAAKTSAWTVGTVVSAYRPNAVVTGKPYYTGVDSARIMMDGTMQITACGVVEVGVSFTYLLA